MRSNCRITMILLTALTAFIALPALAQDTVELSSTQLNYNEEGVKLLGEGDYEGAVNKFRSSLRISEANVTYLNLGRTFQKMGECQKAKEAYGRANDAPRVAQPTPAEISGVLQRYVSELPDVCPTRLELECTPPSMTVEIDGGEAMPCPTGSIEVEPGTHTVRAMALDQTLDETIEIKEGDTAVLELTLEKRVDEGVATNEDTSVTAASPLQRESSSNVWALSLMGVGVAGLATGLILDLAVLGPAIDGGESATTPEDYQDNQSTFDSYRVPTLIAYGVGAAAVTGGLVWWLVSDSTESAGVSAAPTGDGWAVTYATSF